MAWSLDAPSDVTVQTTASRFFVQFPHPGSEHRPADDDMPWNVAQHGRKFLLAPGHYVDAAEQLAAAELAFWGEWEPPSLIEQRWPASDRLPRALHRPYWITPRKAGFLIIRAVDTWEGAPARCKRGLSRVHR